MAAALLLLATAAASSDSAPASYGPASPKPVKVAAQSSAIDPCQAAKLEPDVVVVCGKKEGYRIDPDVLAAQRQHRDHSKPKPPEKFADTSCSKVGTMGCMNPPTIDLLAAALTAVTMANKAIKGENVGKMFVTDPQPTEYQLYQEAKRNREEQEAAALDRAYVEAMPADQQSKP